MAHDSVDRRTGSLPFVRVRKGAVGILESESGLLMVCRADLVPKGGCWCFPGGHVERGETSRQAVVREMAEELGIVVETVRRLGTIRVPDSRHVLAVWRVVQVGGEMRPNPDEIAAFRWTPIDEVAAIPQGLPSNTLVLKMLGYGV